MCHRRHMPYVGPARRLFSIGASLATRRWTSVLYEAGVWVIGVPVRSSAGRALLGVAWELLAAICPVKGNWGRGGQPGRVLPRFLLECKATRDHKKMPVIALSVR